MTKIIKRAVRVLRQLFSNSKKRSLKKTIKRSNKNKLHKGGAVFSFDLNDKIGGMPANVSLNGTLDGDCPSGNTSDIGFSNYGVAKGGKRSISRKLKKSHKSNHSKKSKSHKLQKSKKTRKTHSRKH
jgi:hypothetical protein